MLARATRLSSADVAAIAELAYAEAREFFPAYRRLMHPDMIWGWWVEECSWRFQEFYEQFTAGRRPKVIFEAPPQHGKSSLVEDFICWVSGKNPDLKHMFASYSEDLGKKTNSVVQRQLASDTYALIFPGTRIAEFGRPSPYKRNSELVEYVGREGSFRNTTVEGQSTGKSLHLGYVDDPLKGRAEANSPTIRKNRWEWLTDEFFTRFSDDAGFILTNTRWHVDDPAGRLREKFPDCQVLRYPAIAEQDEAHRRKGEPLFPEHKSLSFLMERKQLMTQASWDSVYQQNPYVVGGGIFPIEKFIILRAVNRDLIEKSVRYWDKAGTDADDGAVAYTAGVLMHIMRENVRPRFVISDVVRGQWSAGRRESHIRQTAELDAAAFGMGRVRQVVEQEPGSGGKESAENTARVSLVGHSTQLHRVTGDKVVRAEPYAAQVENDNVGLVAGPWVRDFLEEHELAPNGRTKDQWDAASGAFSRLAGKRYDSSGAWMGEAA